MTGKWTALGHFYSYGLPAAAVHGDHVYVMGGARSTQSSTTYYKYVRRFHLRTREAESRSDMPVARYNSPAATCGDAIYVTGGYNGYTYLTRTDRYDINTDSWSRKADAPRCHQGTAAGNYQGKLYFAGASRAFDKYDPETDTWSTMPSLPKKSIKIGGVIGGDFYVIAEYSSSAHKIAAYSFQTGTWSWKAQLPQKASGPGASTGTHLFYFYYSNYNSNCYTYDPETDAFTHIDTTLVPHKYGVACGARGYGYVLGGLTGDNQYTDLVEEICLGTTVLSGSVVDENGDPVPNLRVYAVGAWHPRAHGQGTTDSDGNFSIEVAGKASESSVDKVAIFAWPDDEGKAGSVRVNV